MSLDMKILNPINIKLGKDSNVILADNKEKKDLPLEPGALFEGEHYGFVLISDYNGKQTETVYATQCKLEAVCIEGGDLKIFEEGKKVPWRFDKTGKLKNSILDEFTDDFKRKIDDFIVESVMNMENPVLLNPIRINIAKSPEQSVILKDERIKKDYSLYPGLVLGNVHFGFILVVNTEEGEKEIAYPTQNRITAIGCEHSFFDDLRIFEDGKYHPWLFSHDGKLKKEAAYNPYSRRDEAFIQEHFGSSEKALGYVIKK